ncbi:hypothetical protein CUJ88_49405 (plasmid) [Paraburkholderia hospita]|nr:hypothetical protein CUJ88_49405 [Paraburkholderia hospita]
MSRTHWAVKPVDLYAVLGTIGLHSAPQPVPAPVVTPTGALAPQPRPTAALARVPPAPRDQPVATEVLAIRAAFAPADAPTGGQHAVPGAVGDRRRVFVVHGQADGAKHKVARWLEKLGLDAVILDEQDGQGATIIEKFEHEASKADFAVVLLTPDDRGGRAGAAAEGYRARARQNVVFELGYFAAKLERGRVCALKEGDVEIPSDYSGVEYVAYDEHDGWKLKLANRLRGAGMQIDMNRL